MTASAGAWYRVGTVNVTNSQQAVTGVGTNWQNDVISIAVGDIFTRDAKTWYEVTAVNSDTSITLDRDYEGGTENAANYAIVRNTSGTILTRIAGQISVQFNQKQLFLDELRTWLNSNNATEELTDSHGLKQAIKTPHQMIDDAEQAASTARSEWNAARDAVETRAQTAYREAVEAASSGKNTVKYDAQGNPNVMVWIPKFNSEDVNQAIIDRHGVDLQLGTGVFPAFIKNGVQMRGFWYAKYIASAGENGGCSVISGVQPRTYVNYDTAKSLCTNKGTGWHLSANIEWLAVAYLGLAFGDQPRGDTNYGRAYDAKHEVATRASAAYAPGDTGHSAPSYTGTGPASWSHDGTQFGVFDMVGNVWEWQDQLKLQEGQIFAPLDNNPDMPESDWPAHECYFDSSGSSGGSVVLNSQITNQGGDIGDNGSGNFSNSNTWRTMSKGSSYVENLLMRQMGIEPADGALFNGTLYSRNFGERVPSRGGRWRNTSAAGLGALYFHNDRARAGSSFGFRPALFES
ncbi:SUMF1/EgtB/PvdO family nonheme iron enzyme [Pseudoalteromonas sp. SCSIO 43088]|uniref:SUMF1/EgtB/PvdO family nonheme iron enzyme n=1 Tax=Pseudoalteromonas sp. SCSIO 43088 TaxID=2822846 RepID=UPI00202B5026|nr:SUMF1/EgtB/PvdO family nonheme iron enzyme [Pseudoalteromonas sp. SCSIO 43088]URQ87734.1 SUMF1/EgtB/PvdO family nonheme iron enzyme [Pseudoalteromonas sp. SCSIO 43088]